MKAAAYIAANEWEVQDRTCIECGTGLESWQVSRCQDCISKSLGNAVVANSIRWQTCDGAKTCFDCPMADTPDCERYQVHLTEIGKGDDYGPNPWNMQTAEMAGAFSPRCD